MTADDFATGSRAALAGGTTTVLDFATQFHGESLAEGLAHWHRKADGSSVCDYGFHLAMTEWRPEFADELPAIAEAGVTSFKMYMAYRHSMMVEDDEIYAALTAASAFGGTIGFHCENGRLIDALVREHLAERPDRRLLAPAHPPARAGGGGTGEADDDRGAQGRAALRRPSQREGLRRRPRPGALAREQGHRRDLPAVPRPRPHGIRAGARGPRQASWLRAGP